MVQPSSESAPTSWVERQVEALAAARARGERPRATHALAERPDVDTEIALRLIYEEVCLRRESGEEFDTDEVIRQYPRWAAELRDLLDCDRLLGPEGARAGFPEVGEPLGPFVLLEELGRGASGRTFLATDPTLANRPVVVKVIPDHQDEHLALASLRHTHIVPLFSEHAFPERGLRGLCMPYLGGASLGEVLHVVAADSPSQRSGVSLVRALDQFPARVPAPSAPLMEGPFRRGLERASYPHAIAWVAVCLADALHYAHARGLVHMDVKPSNVLISADCQPMLLDFHLARGPIAAGEYVTDRLGGTPGWMSPEQEAAMAAASRGLPVPRAVDARTDVYALGLVLREALARQGGVRGGPALFEPSSDVGPGLADIARKCLAPLPRDRYPDANALAEDLRRELADLPLRGVRNRSPRELWRKWRRRHAGTLAGWVALGGLGALTITGGLVVANHRQGMLQVQDAVEEARQDTLAGRHDSALRTLRRADEEARNLLLMGRLRDGIDREMARAQRGHDADELHRFADILRFRYGIDSPDPDEAQTLAPLCRSLWEHWERVLRSTPASLPFEVEERIRTDLVEVLAIWADLRLGMAGGEAREATQAENDTLFDEAEALCGRSMALDVRRDPKRSVPLPSAQPKTPFEYYDLGRSHLRAGRLDEAAGAFERTLEERPRDFWSTFYLGLCHFRLGRLHDAIADFRVCITLEPKAAVCHYDLGRTREALGQIDEAARDYTRALAHDPKLIAAQLNRGVIAHQRGRFDDAIADFDEALRQRPDRATRGLLHYNKALALKAQGHRVEALADAEASLQLGHQGAKALRDDLRLTPR